MKLSSIKGKARKVMSSVKEQYERYEEALRFQEVIDVAIQLLKQYGSSKNIPDNEFKQLEGKNGLDAAKTKAMTIIIEKDGLAFKKELH